MAVTLPNRPDLTHHDFQISLDGVTYVLEFKWNVRDAAWYMDVRLADGTDVVSGIKVVVEFPLGRRSSSAARPPGMFIAFDSSGKRQDPGLEDLGARVEILYFDKTEVAVFRAAAGL